jgi:hypothetical protein
MQNGKPTAFASTSLTNSERSWVMLEKELLAIVFGMAKFRQYIYGRHITEETDHLPLISVVNNLYTVPTQD